MKDAARHEVANPPAKQHAAVESRRARPVSKAPAVAPAAPAAQPGKKQAAQKAGGASPPQTAGGASPPRGEVAQGSAQALIDDAMAAAAVQADSARAPEVGGRELPSYQSEAQLPRKPNPASDMD